jgi:hypothetical protein
MTTSTANIVEILIWAPQVCGEDHTGATVAEAVAYAASLGGHAQILGADWELSWFADSTDPWNWIKARGPVPAHHAQELERALRALAT